ncbi:hypothetical protein BDF19DRAFT_312513 [Syncephalis fuscata]|nr:hypothetical protein BDF19DRAFT_312513 [Syncephalis fuscata]
MKFVVAIVAIMTVAVLSANADDPPTGYPGQDSFRIAHGDKCLKLKGNDDPWYEPCIYDDPLDFASLWKAISFGEYSQIQNVQTGKCLYEGRPTRIKDCSEDGSNLWRFYHGDDYEADEEKMIPKASDDRNKNLDSCLSYDRTIFFIGHSVTFACNRNDRNQFFKRMKTAPLPRY